VSILKEHQRAGHQVILMSGSPDCVVAPLGHALGVDLVVATPISLHGARPAARSAEIVVGRRKQELLEGLASRLEFDCARSFAYADHHSDRKLLEAVGSPVAVYPNRRLRRIATARRWRVVDDASLDGDGGVGRQRHTVESQA
jgi:phosphoserine phosphatase